MSEWTNPAKDTKRLIVKSKKHSKARYLKILRRWVLWNFVANGKYESLRFFYFGGQNESVLCSFILVFWNWNLGFHFLAHIELYIVPSSLKSLIVGILVLDGLLMFSIGLKLQLFSTFAAYEPLILFFFEMFSNNILYPKEDKEQSILLYACRNCDHQVNFVYYAFFYKIRFP